MKNKNIITAWDEIVPSEETENKMFGNIQKKLQSLEKRPVFKPAKIIAVTSAMILLIGLINIQTVIAFVNGLFFAPGVGVITSDGNVIYYGLEKPVAIETEYGVLTVEFISKITNNGKTDLNVYIDTNDIPGESAYDADVTVEISAEGETIIPPMKTENAGGAKNDGVNESFFYFTFKDFPDINEFDLTLCGVKTHIALTNQQNNFAVSKVNNGIAYALYKIDGANHLLFFDIYGANLGYDDYTILPFMSFTGDSDYHYYDIDGNAIRMNGGSNGFLNNHNNHYVNIHHFAGNDTEIKSVKSNSVEMLYDVRPNRGEIIEIPIPEDNEIIKTDIRIPIGQYDFTISEIRREGDVIYYEHNSLSKSKVEDVRNNKGISYSTSQDTDTLENWIVNGEAVIRSVSLMPAYWNGWENWYESPELHDDWIKNGTKVQGGVIINFDENAETLKVKLVSANIIQYGNFDVEFN